MTTKDEGIPELLTASEVARVLRISERSVWRLCADGKLPSPLHVGGAARWKKSDIEEWFQRATEISHETRVKPTLESKEN